MADELYNIIKSFDIREDQIIGICADTTSANSGHKSGAIALLSKRLKVPLLGLLCRKHSFERHVFHCFKNITGYESKSPAIALYSNFKDKWKDYHKLVNEDHSLLIKFPWDEAKYVALHDQAKESLSYAKHLLEQNEFIR